MPVRGTAAVDDGLGLGLALASVPVPELGLALVLVRVRPGVAESDGPACTDAALSIWMTTITPASSSNATATVMPAISGALLFFGGGLYMLAYVGCPYGGRGVGGCHCCWGGGGTCPECAAGAGCEKWPG